MVRQPLVPTKVNVVILICVTLGGLFPTAAAANPFHIGRYGGIVGNGATHRSPFATYWNPAGLVEVGFGLQLHGMLVNRQASFNRDAALNAVPEELEGVNSGLAETTALGVVPAIAFQSGHDLGGLTLGLGIAGFIDRAGRTNWKKNYSALPQYPGAIDGAQRWSVINTELTMYNVGIGLGLEHVASGLALGLTWIGTQTHLSTIRARTVNATDEVLIEGHLAEGRVLFRDGEAQGFTLVIGSQWEAHEIVTVGVAWQSPVTYKIEGDSLIQFGEAEETREPAETSIQVPQGLRTEVRIDASPMITLRPAFIWNQWSVVRSQVASGVRTGEILFRTPRNFKDTFEVSLGTDIHFNGYQSLNLMLGYENGATPKQTHEPGLAESDNARFGVGVTSQWTETLSTHLAFVWQAFADVTVTDSIQKPTTNGRYTDQRQFLTLDMEVAL